jgi:hypothetical protein
MMLPYPAASLVLILVAGLISANSHGRACNAAVTTGLCLLSVLPSRGLTLQSKSILPWAQELTLLSVFLRACGLQNLTILGVVIYERTGDEHHMHK